MTLATEKRGLPEAVAELVRQDLDTPDETPRFESDPLWRGLGELGTELWLDTGNIDDARAQWTAEFRALTTNNSLLNKEVQQGTYDDLIGRADRVLKPFGLSEQQRVLEIAFVLNARHALRLVGRFGANVSVEEHTGLAHDVEAAVAYARRYHAICPEHFIVKLPFTPAGILATRTLSGEGVPVNHTLGFSARQNYLVTRLAAPAYVNVFLGRLNAFVADNDLGDGTYVGERAVLASQACVRQVRERRGAGTRQIGASIRDGEQVRDLAGLDVLTMPPKAARAFGELGLTPDALADRTVADYRPPLAEGVDERAVGLDTLWEVPDRLVEAVDALDGEDLDAFGPDDLVRFLADRDCGDVLVNWSDQEVRRSAAEGKIPELAHWADDLSSGRIGLDALMNLAGLNAFAADQSAMDDRVRGLL